VWDAAFSPDGRLVVTASADKTARVWDAATGEPVTPPLKHGAEVTRASFSPDGRRLFTITGGVLFDRYLDRQAWVWDLTPDPRPIQDLGLLARVLSAQRIGAAGAAPVEMPALSSAWERLRAKYPGEFAIARR